MVQTAPAKSAHDLMSSGIENLNTTPNRVGFY